MISSQCFSELIPPDCKLHNYFSLLYLLGEIGWLELAGAGYILSPGSDNIPEGQALGNNFPLRAGHVKNMCFGIFQNGSFTLPLSEVQKYFTLIVAIRTWSSSWKCPLTWSLVLSLQFNNYNSDFISPVLIPETISIHDSLLP